AMTAIQLLLLGAVALTVTAGLFAVARFSAHHATIPVHPHIRVHHNPAPQVRVHHNPAPQVRVHHNPAPHVRVHHNPTPHIRKHPVNMGRPAHPNPTVPVRSAYKAHFNKHSANLQKIPTVAASTISRPPVTTAFRSNMHHSSPAHPVHGFRATKHRA
ncbi:MAG TPA: hypothetical protein VFP93_02180, partial [Gammaproteobacteria bacterium]|nr:hypothetical protein [Gammaproteobacteria bacterium]